MMLQRQLVCAICCREEDQTLMVWVRGRGMVMGQFHEHGWYRAPGSHGLLLRHGEGGLMVSQKRGWKRIRG